MNLPASWILPDWPAAPRVRAFVTTREGGVSTGEFSSMNLGGSSGDDADRVARNRAVVRALLPADPAYMAQVHGTTVADLDALIDGERGRGDGERVRADAAVTSSEGRVAVVLTADCMPIFFADRAGRRVGVAHAGWRGLSAGVIESTLAALGPDPADVVAWMGPTIGPAAFEVGAEVKQAFERHDPEAARAFAPHLPGKYMADLYLLARQRFARAGVREVHGGGFCTFRDTDRFFSYRRAQKSGRMGAFIWME
jgi:purine-nucleoside/S-methyl-5'-thioadenosine phosphorylase / adenosine deaminase